MIFMYRSWCQCVFVEFFLGSFPFPVDVWTKTPTNSEADDIFPKTHKQHTARPEASRVFVSVRSHTIPDLNVRSHTILDLYVIF